VAAVAVNNARYLIFDLDDTLTNLLSGAKRYPCVRHRRCDTSRVGKMLRL